MNSHVVLNMNVVHRCTHTLFIQVHVLVCTRVPGTSARVTRTVVHTQYKGTGLGTRTAVYTQSTSKGIDNALLTKRFVLYNINKHFSFLYITRYLDAGTCIDSVCGNFRRNESIKRWALFFDYVTFYFFVYKNEKKNLRSPRS